MFIKSKYNEPNEYLREVLQPQLIPVLTVHDEIDYLVDDFLLKPIMKETAIKSTVKPLINKLGVPFINFTYDIEWGINGCWSPNNKFDYISYPRTAEEDKAKKLWEKELESDSGEDIKREPISVPVLKIEYQESDMNESILEKLLMCDKGNDVFIIHLDSGKKAILSGLNLQTWNK